jgi:hypothetical protein
MAKKLADLINGNNHLLDGFPIEQYNVGPFYDDTPLKEDDGNNGKNGNGGDTSGSRGEVVGLVLGFSITLFCLSILLPLLAYLRRRKKKEEE